MCCGDSLQAQAKNVARFQMVVCTFILVFATPIWVYMDKEYPHRTKENAVVYAMYVGTAIAGLIIAAILHVGSEEGSATKCLVWLIVKSIFVILNAGGNTATLIIAHFSSEMILDVVGMALSLYFIHIVYSYWKELRDRKDLREGQAMDGV